MKLTTLVLILVWGVLSQAAQTVDLAERRMFSIMVLPGGRSAVVGLVDGRDGMAAFAKCRLSGSTFEACTEGSRFPLSQISRVEALFEEKLAAKIAGGAESWGYDIGVLLGMGATSPGAAAAFEVTKGKPALPAQVKTNYSGLFNTNLSAPRFVPFDAQGGRVSAKAILSALSEAASHL